MIPVIAVATGNPKNISTLDDLMRDDVRVSVGNPIAASIGKATRRGMGARWDEFAKKATVMKPTVMKIALDLQLGAVDAEAFCLEHGMSRYDARLVAWLVQHHLLLSVTAQKKDLHDPRVINDLHRR